MEAGRKEVREGRGGEKGGGKGDRGGEVCRFHKGPLPALQLSTRCRPPP